MQSNQRMAVAGVTALALLGVAGAYYYLNSSVKAPYALQQKTGKMLTLYKKEADLRSTIISNVKYRIIYAMLPGGKTFRGRVTVNFDVSDRINEGIVREDKSWSFLDYKGHAVHKLVMNGTEIPTDKINFKDERIYFDMDILKEGTNEAVVDFESSYIKDCQGIQYFKDPEDQEEYIYSQFEAADAHRAFPCFD